MVDVIVTVVRWAKGLFVILLKELGAEAYGTDISKWAMRDRIDSDLILGDAKYLPAHAMGRLRNETS